MDTFAKPVPYFDLYYDASSRTTSVYSTGYYYAGRIRYGSATGAGMHVLCIEAGQGHQQRHDVDGSMGDVR